jgi:hypothetical protein
MVGLIMIVVMFAILAVCIYKSRQSGEIHRKANINYLIRSNKASRMGAKEYNEHYDAYMESSKLNAKTKQIHTIWMTAAWLAAVFLVSLILFACFENIIIANLEHECQCTLDESHHIAKSLDFRYLIKD